MTAEELEFWAETVQDILASAIGSEITQRAYPEGEVDRIARFAVQLADRVLYEYQLRKSTVDNDHAPTPPNPPTDTQRPRTRDLSRLGDE